MIWLICLIVKNPRFRGVLTANHGLLTSLRLAIDISRHHPAYPYGLSARSSPYPMKANTCHASAHPTEPASKGPFQT